MTTEGGSDAREGAQEFRSGLVALIGRPNSGKSTLLNTVLGEELSVVSSLPQTTRRSLRGVYTESTVQIVFVDTPGIHDGSHRYNKAMSAESRAVARDKGIDALAYVVDLGRESGAEEDAVAAVVRGAAARALIVFNKLDRCNAVDARVAAFAARYPALAACPAVRVQATRPETRAVFVAAVTPLLPVSAPLYPVDELTDENMRFFAAEYLRKGIIACAREEVPHACAVEILAYDEQPRRHLVDAVIHVETDGQRGILIGKGGAMIGRIRSLAEVDMSRLAGVPVRYRLHVKISAGWRDKPGFLRGMGYRDA